MANAARKELPKEAPKPRINDLRVIDTKKASGYRFLDKDPELEEVVAAISASGLTPEAIERETVKIGRKVSASAIIGWTHGKTRRPQNYTMASVMIALGYSRGKWSKVV